LHQVAGNPYLSGPYQWHVPCDDGCTMVGMVLLPHLLISFNVGDSRLTLFKSSNLQTRTCV
jgi:serine/threonine protein phosphatase PrpC